MSASTSPALVNVVTYGRAVVQGARTVFLVHGAGMDQSVWTLQGRFLAFHGWNALAIDLPGHGRSRLAAPLLTVSRMADWLATAIEGGGLGPVALVGHSMGALIALDLAGRRPELVTALCLLGASLRMPVHPQLLAAADHRETRAVDLITDWSFGHQAHLGGSRVPGGWIMGQARSLLLRGDPAVLAADLAACNTYQEGGIRAAAVHCPSLVVIGEEDRMTPLEAGRELAAALARSRTQVIPRAGHMMMLERPEETLEAIASFLG